MVKHKVLNAVFTAVVAISLNSSFFISASTSCQFEYQVGNNVIQVQRSSLKKLCTLVKLTNNGKSWIPLGRSYNGKEWEKVAGPLASDITFNCNEKNTTLCTVNNLPTLNINEAYKVHSFNHTLSRNEELARFLEQASFGTTKDDIKRFKHKDTDVAIAQWIYQQIHQENATSHREWFRRRVNHRFPEPHPVAIPYHACQKNTRWRKYAISSKDIEKYVKVQKKEEKVILSLDGYTRTIVDSLDWYSSVYIRKNGHLSNNSYKICASSIDCSNCPFLLEDPQTKSCQETVYNGIQYGNPPIMFNQTIDELPERLFYINEENVHPINDQFFFRKKNNSSSQELILIKPIENPFCENIEAKYDATPVFGFYLNNMNHYIHDPPPQLRTNTLKYPALDGGSHAAIRTHEVTYCANTPRTFLNENYCRISSAKPCSRDEFPTLDIELSHDNLRTFYKVTSKESEMETRYVYVIDGLRIEEGSNTDPPCRPNSVSRWIPLPKGSDCNNNNLRHRTNTFLSKLLSKISHTNSYVRDILTTSSTECHKEDLQKKGLDILDRKGICWRHVHQNHLQVYDMTYWTYDDTHPGNSETYNPIKESAEKKKGAVLHFPGWHDMNRWIENKMHFHEIGRFGDTISFADLPPSLRSNFIANAFLKNSNRSINESNINNIVCGSPGEVENDPTLGGGESYGAFDLCNKWNRTTSSGSFKVQRKTVWTMIALTAKDQLRQRMAWALNQIFAIASSSISTLQHTEMYVNYYDIFVRNAFGNYRQVLKEVAFSDIMAENLSFLGSKSSFYNWDKYGKFSYPDENFAREIMQLFTIGLCKLNLDGSEINDNGVCQRAYTNDDIIEYSRAWTGFTHRPFRGNMESQDDRNHIDPMMIEVSWRDMFPKLGLNEVYIGDGYPRCQDRSKRHFLKRGAKYILLGSSSYPDLQVDPMEWKHDWNVKRLTLTTDSYLYKILCNPDNTNNSNCQPQSIVKLQTDINACFGIECDIDTIRVVQVTPSLFYEYISEPCVEQAFYRGKTVVNKKKDKIMCAHPVREVASSACCSDTTENKKSPFYDAHRRELYWGERMTFATAKARCKAMNQPMCKFPSLKNDCRVMDENGQITTKSECLQDVYYWTKSSCGTKVKINAGNGNVAIVHEPGVGYDRKFIAKEVQSDTLSYFRVKWKLNTYPSPSNNCGRTVHCKILDNNCLCSVKIQITNVFRSFPITPKDVISKLHIGSYSPESLGYTTSIEQNGVRVFYQEKDKIFSKSSILEVRDPTTRIIRYFKNMKSTVIISNTFYEFRNPPHFLSLIDGQPRDAYFETDAAIDQYFYHTNTAPFLAIRLIQRFGTSNPSPRYIQDVASTFRLGKYNWIENNSKKLEFGSGKYGDLAATISAILLHDESRSVVLDDDPTHGSLREPLLKVISFLRSMEYQMDDDKPFVEFQQLEEKIGQMAYEFPSVFSFFLPEYQPSGIVADIKLVSPEAQALTASNMIGTVNGLFSLIKWGFNSAYDGFFSSREGKTNRDPGDFFTSVRFLSILYLAPQLLIFDNLPIIAHVTRLTAQVGKLGFTPNAEIQKSKAVINELSLLLTSGRLSSEKKYIIQDIYSQEPNKTAALMMAQQLIVTTAEYHSTGGLVQKLSLRKYKEKNNMPTPPPQITKSATKPYKAVVFLFLSGGYDSFNMLVPRCEPLYTDYKQKRAQVALSRGEIIPISIDMTLQQQQQPCADFGLHHKLTILQKSFQQKKTLFFANTGVLNQAINKSNYKELTETQLFAHNTMQEEAKRVDPFHIESGTGILGRLSNVLFGLKEGTNNAMYKVSSIGIESASIALEGGKNASSEPIIVGIKGAKKFDPFPWNKRKNWQHVDLFPHIQKLNDVTTGQDNNIFAETWSSNFLRVIAENDALYSTLNEAQIVTKFSDDDYSAKLKQIAKFVNTTDIRGNIDREIFHVEFPGWDHHFNLKINLEENFHNLNAALESFWMEMSAQGKENNVVLVAVSDFGRTLTPNSSEGTDHAWGGHYFIMGGNVKGGRILGKYPDNLKDSELNVDERGRLIPTTSWDSIWNGVCQWMGVEEDTLDEIIPNRHTCGSNLFVKSDLFEDDSMLSASRHY